jgi:hypothetical protein
MTAKKRDDIVDLLHFHHQHHQRRSLVFHSSVQVIVRWSLCVRLMNPVPATMPMPTLAGLAMGGVDGLGRFSY